jgi:hypothetical protein
VGDGGGWRKRVEDSGWRGWGGLGIVLVLLLVLVLEFVF